MFTFLFEIHVNILYLPFVKRRQLNMNTLNSYINYYRDTRQIVTLAFRSLCFFSCCDRLSKKERENARILLKEEVKIGDVS